MKGQWHARDTIQLDLEHEVGQAVGLSCVLLLSEAVDKLVISGHSSARCCHSMQGQCNTRGLKQLCSNTRQLFMVCCPLVLSFHLKHVATNTLHDIDMPNCKTPHFMQLRSCNFSIAGMLLFIMHSYKGVQDLAVLTLASCMQPCSASLCGLCMLTTIYILDSHMLFHQICLSLCRQCSSSWCSSACTATRVCGTSLC